jgi:hypothetical protein
VPGATASRTWTLADDMLNTAWSGVSIIWLELFLIVIVEVVVTSLVFRLVTDRSDFVTLTKLLTSCAMAFVEAISQTATTTHPQPRIALNDLHIEAVIPTSLFSETISENHFLLNSCKNKKAGLRLQPFRCCIRQSGQLRLLEAGFIQIG